MLNSSEKEVFYTTSNTYTTLNALTPNTQNIWFACHGMGYLSKYFARYFSSFNADENYFIFPQAQSKYYLPPKFKYVGASWLTKENTIKETENVMRYFDAVFALENIQNTDNLIVLGFSQGVSVAMRYVAKRKLHCKHLIIMSGGIPKELTASDFEFLPETTKISLIYGTNDEYFDASRMEYEINRARELFGNKVAIYSFEGKHEVNSSLLKSIL